MEKESKLWKSVIVVSIVVAVIVAVLASLIRTEQRFRRLIGVLRSRMPKKQKNQGFHIELEEI